MENPQNKTGKPGGQLNNRNSVRHGLTTGKMPPSAGRVIMLVRKFRESVAEAVSAERGEINIYDAALIDSAAHWQRHSLLAQRWLRVDYENLSMDSRLSYSREVARAASERDRCLKLLKLDQMGGGDEWDRLGPNHWDVQEQEGKEAEEQEKAEEMAPEVVKGTTVEGTVGKLSGNCRETVRKL